MSGGKRIRPMLVYICGSNNRFSTEHLLKASTVIELVHIATLVHDDILDSASFRRGKPTLHIPYGQHNSILLGDALFSFALELATDFPDSTVCKIVSTATRKTCSGEINQTFHARILLFLFRNIMKLFKIRLANYLMLHVLLAAFWEGKIRV